MNTNNLKPEILGPDHRVTVRLGGDRTPAKTKSSLGQGRAGRNPKLEDLLQDALKLHQDGNLAEAANTYHNILEKDPGRVDVIFLLGTLNIQQGNLELATTYLKKAISLKPDHVAACNNLGTALQSQGRLSEAVVIYNRIIELKPDYAEAHYNLGNALRKKCKPDEAASCFSKAIKLNPNYIEAHGNLGSVLQEQGKFDEAVASYRRAIELNPDHVEIHNILGAVLKEQHKLDEAVASFRQAIELNPDYAEAHNNLGAVRQEQHKVDEAIVNYRQAISLKPDYAVAHNNLGTALKEQNKTDEAVASYRRAISLKPDYAEAHYNLGSIFSEQSKLDEAMECYKQAISLKPDYAEAYNNLGAVLHEQRKPDEAIKNYNRSIAIKPDYTEAHFNKSLALLLAGNFEDGWPEYEWRLSSKDCTSHTFQQPQWDGTPLNGRSILVHAEQGFGDTIQFVRYLPMVKAKGGHVIFECQKNLFRLLKSCTGIDEIIEQGPTRTPVAQFDIHVPLLSLPGIFGTTLNTIPSDVPYITADPDLVKQWSSRFSHNDAYKVGIVWAGNPTHTYNGNRSCSLSDFAPLADIPDLIFYSLQKGPASTEANDPPKGMKIINLEDSLIDFADTAAVIANLDLVISIDTAVVHLAGAIDKPVWTLPSSVPDWRWLLNRDDSPWYPRTKNAEDFPRQNGLAGRAGMRLFRQTKPNDWTEVFEQVKKALLYKLNTEEQISEDKRVERVTSV